MSTWKFSNFVRTTLQAELGIADTALVVELAAAQEMPTLAGVEQFALTLTDGDGQFEIVYATANPQTGTLTVVRAREGTGAYVWPEGTEVRLALTREILYELITIATTYNADFVALQAEFDALELDVTDLDAALTAGLAGKADLVHTHAQGDITGLVAALAGKAPTAHTHDLADVTDAGVLAAGDDAGDVPVTPVGTLAATNAQAAFAELDSEKAPTVHTHTIAQITDFNVQITPPGLLSLSNGIIQIAGVSAATAIYYVAVNGGYFPLYDGTVWSVMAFTQLSLNLDSDSGHTGYHQSGKNFDCFVYNDAGTLRMGTGPAWTSDTGRGTGAATSEIARQNGLWVNANQINLRFGSAAGNLTTGVLAGRAVYVGTFRTVADGQTEQNFTPAAAAGGSHPKLFVFNAHNRRLVIGLNRDSTDSWNYTTLTWRSSNNSANNRISFLRGLEEEALEAIYHQSAANSGGTPFFVGIALDATGAPTTSGLFSIEEGGSGSKIQGSASFASMAPGLGLHFLQQVEQSIASNTTTFYGDDNSANTQSGMILRTRM